MTAITHTLVLDSAGSPHDLISWREAAELLYKGRARIERTYDEVLRVVRREWVKAAKETRSLSESMLKWFEMGVDSSDPNVLVLHIPAVIRLLGVYRKRDVKFSRINVLTRDNFTCQYCGKKRSSHELNYDHVIPRSQGGKTCWENIVMACSGPGECNALKADRTPAEAGMRLLHKPVKPKSLPVASLRLERFKDLPEMITSYLYWNAELEP